MRILGYAFSGLGIVGIVAGMNLKAGFMGIKQGYIMVAGAALVIIGLFFMFQKSGIKAAKQEKEEVPIYKGNKIVGYRREK